MPTIMIVLAIVVVLVSLSLRVVKEYDRGVIFFLGSTRCSRSRFDGTLIPVPEQMTRVTLRTITMNIPSQKIITKDNVSIDIAAVGRYYHIVDQEIGDRHRKCERRHQPDGQARRPCGTSWGNSASMNSFHKRWLSTRRLRMSLTGTLSRGAPK